MKNKLTKGNFIAIAMAAVLAVGGFGVYSVNAASSIDSSLGVQIQANVVDETGKAEFFEHYKGTVTINLYKIADMDNGGNFGTVSSKFSDVDLSALTLGNENNTVAGITKKIVEPAIAKVKTVTTKKSDSDGCEITEVKYSEPDYTFTIDRAKEATSGSVTVEKGLYLYVPVDCENARYSYTFTPYVIMAPTSEFIYSSGAEGTSDAWITNEAKTAYLSEFNLKPQETLKYGDLKIVKTLSSYNTSLGTAAFVYDIEEQYDDDGDGTAETVYSNVASIDFTEAGQNSVVVHHIPAGATVSVTEVYTGASYSLTSDASTTATIVADVFEGDDNIPSVSFANSYDDRLEVGGASIVNKYTATKNTSTETTGTETTVTYEWSSNQKKVTTETTVEGGN